MVSILILNTRITIHPILFTICHILIIAFHFLNICMYITVSYEFVYFLHIIVTTTKCFLKFILIVTSAINGLD